MALESKTFESLRDSLKSADAVYRVDFTTLNSSGVSAEGVLSLDRANMTLDVGLAGNGFASGQTVVQHIHGLFDGDGNNIDSQTPTIANDTDQDGMVEVLEGVPSYGDIIMSLVNDSDGFDTTTASGDFSFFRSYDLTDDSLFGSIVTGNDYAAEDLLPLQLREVVLHGMEVPNGIGSGTGGEVDGSQDGFVQLLPATAGEIEAASLKQAMATVDMQADMLGETADLGRGNQTFNGGIGNDVVKGQRGSDSLFGGGGDDFLRGSKGGDLLVGNDGDDTLIGNRGRDIFGGGGGNDFIEGGQGKDEFHFDAGTGKDKIRDFTSGEDVISILDGGAIDFANSSEDASGRGDSDLDSRDFDTIENLADIVGANDGQIIYSKGGMNNVAWGLADDVEAYVAVANAKRTKLFYDDDWSDLEGREEIAVLHGFTETMTASDFDVY
ncbi:calcium-binding protein [Chachezhania antarctica]|uniref:calcium-binding protein n=1 Tax=Chachezhania antarctica TaxID=2340860 RepID=UPI000EB226CE|nr:calcium-binding protein [Chachezhania antarctica]